MKRKHTKKSKSSQKSSLRIAPLLVIGSLIIGILIFGYNYVNPRFYTAEADTSGGLVVDHTSVALFEQIPDEYITAAQNLHMFFLDRSVGANINDGLNCLEYPSDEEAPNSCKRYRHQQTEFASPQSWVNWSRTGGYDRSNWDFFFEKGLGGSPEVECPNAEGIGMWFGLGSCFDEFARNNVSQYDVMSFQFSYLSVTDNSDIAHPTTGFFVDQPNKYDVYDYARLESDYPDKTIIYWTTSLARNTGSAVSDSFNQQMRQFATANNKVLFDVADIIANSPTGESCYDNRDAVEYCTASGRCENYPDDGQQYQAICQHFTTEIDGGHLYDPAKIAVAKAYWVLMAQIAGWNPDGTSQSTPVPTSTLPTATPVQSSPTLQPTATSVPTLTPTDSPNTTDPDTVYHLNFDDEGNMGSCYTCNYSNTTVVSNGVQNNAFSFNGTNSYVRLGNLSHIKGQSEFSFTVWVNPAFATNSSSWHYVYSDGNAMSLWFLPNNADWRLFFRTANGTYRLDTQGVTWNTNTWHQLSVVYTGSQVRLYWDGTLEATAGATGNVVTDGMTALVGTSITNTNSFSGLIDELKIYDTALTDAEVSSLFTNRN